MPTRPAVHRPPGAPTAADRQRRQDARRGNSAERGYGHRWRLARRAYLREHPLCVECKSQGVVRAAQVVDHIVPHRGDAMLFWDESNWQPLCVPHHNAKTARGE